MPAAEDCLHPVHILRTSLRCFGDLETIFFFFCILCLCLEPFTLSSLGFGSKVWEVEQNYQYLPHSVSAIPPHMASQKRLGKPERLPARSSLSTLSENMLPLQLPRVTVQALQGCLVARQLGSQSKPCTLWWTLPTTYSLPEKHYLITRKTKSPGLHFDKMLSLRSPPHTLF